MDQDSVTYSDIILNLDGGLGYKISLKNRNKMTPQSLAIHIDQNTKVAHIHMEVKEQIMHHLDDSLQLHNANKLLENICKKCHVGTLGLVIFP